jgi:DedD protein
MGWALGRRGEAASGDEAARAVDRDGEVADPAAELRTRARRRLIGAAVLLLASVFLVPLLLDSKPRPVSDPVITMPAQPAQVAASAEPTRDTEASTPAAPATAAEPTWAEVPAAKAARPLADTPTPAAAPSERFALQVAAMATVGAANQLAARLKKAGFGAYVEAVDTSEGQRHRVRVGPYASREEAQRVSERLRASGFAAALVAG